MRYKIMKRSYGDKWFAYEIKKWRYLYWSYEGSYDTLERAKQAIYDMENPAFEYDSEKEPLDNLKKGNFI